MSLRIRKAQRSATKGRVLFEGPAGAGKTMSSIIFGYGMLKTLGLTQMVAIDTERGSSDAYEDRIPTGFKVIDLVPPYKPELLIEAIELAEAEGADVIVIDSISHFWSGEGGCLEINEDLAKSKYRGNSWSAWSETKRRWRRMVERINASSAHVLVTGRSKTETAQTEEGGRKKVVRLGMKLEAGDAIEYEFQLAFGIVHDGHLATVTKDRTALFVDRDPAIITEEFGERFAKWLLGGKAVPAPPPELVEKPFESELYEQIRDYIPQATNGQMKLVRQRIESLHEGGQLTNKERDDLLAQCDTI